MTEDVLIINPGFESGTTGWKLHSYDYGNFTIVDPGFNGGKTAKINVTSDSPNLQLYQSGRTLEPNTKYKLSFIGRSETDRNFDVRLMKHTTPFTNYGLNKQINLTKVWVTHSIEFITSGFESIVNDARLQFWLTPYAKSGDEYFIDDVKIEVVIPPDPIPDPVIEKFLITIKSIPPNSSISIN